MVLIMFLTVDMSIMQGFIAFVVTQHILLFELKNLKFKFNRLNEVKENTGVICDQVGILTGLYSSKDYPNEIR